ncbi:type VII secretion integral membrane protein EccD [Nocardioides sp. BP30]|uniref:type VII secretion integral membrane protein EccD n=1 Tax=Nocardioides sp. BP30 TaxID=3036374 RepID=UPI0024698321|nr:type VII secretion integral membrane protein EccD [Nocardioides sp. BP30]WGL52754.1 type VII secretion integral membrane protein EccD [Nocardioides sp. BP30]
MTQAPAAASGLVRVTVASGTRRVDLVLPGAVPVAELVPELARSVGLLDAATVYGGYRLVLPDGRRLALDSGLISQGIEDGGVLTLSAGVDEPTPRVYDDVVEAMTDVVERELRPWRPEQGRLTALVASALFLLLGAVALLVQHESRLAGVAAGVVAAVLVGAAVVLSRAEREPEASVAVAWLAAAYGAVSGLVLAWQSAGAGVEVMGLPLAAAGGAVLLVGFVGLLGLAVEGRTLLLPAAVVGAILLAVGLIVRAGDWDGSVVLTVVLVVVVLAGGVFPWLALGMTSTDVDRLYSPQDITADPAAIDPTRVAADARIAHEILIGISATVGVLLVLVAPFAVGLGLWGTLLAVASCAAVMLRTRQYRTGSEVLVGLVLGVVALVVTGAALLWLHPSWRPTTAVVLAAVGAVVLAGTMLPATPSVRRGRLGDVAESVSLVLLLPLLVLASGVFGSVSI